MEIAGSMPELCELTPGGARLAPAVALNGIETIRFLTNVLPALAELSDLTLETHGTPASYREAESLRLPWR